MLKRNTLYVNLERRKVKRKWKGKKVERKESVSERKIGHRPDILCTVRVNGQKSCSLSERHQVEVRHELVFHLHSPQLTLPLAFFLTFSLSKCISKKFLPSQKVARIEMHLIFPSSDSLRRNPILLENRIKEWNVLVRRRNKR